MSSDKNPNTKEIGRTKWQIKMMAKKKCVVCGKAATTKKLKNGKTKTLSLCEPHRRDRASRAIRRYYQKKETQ